MTWSMSCSDKKELSQYHNSCTRSKFLLYQRMLLKYEETTVQSIRVHVTVRQNVDMYHGHLSEDLVD